MNEYQLAKKTCDVTVGESVKIIRELQGLSQNELAALTGIRAYPEFCVNGLCVNG